MTIHFTFFIDFKKEDDAKRFEGYFPVGNDHEKRSDALGLVAQDWPEGENWDNSALARDGAFIHANGATHAYFKPHREKSRELKAISKLARWLVIHMVGEEGAAAWVCEIGGKRVTPERAFEHAIASGLAPSWLMTLATRMPDVTVAVRTLLAAGHDPNLELRHIFNELFPFWGPARYRLLDFAADQMASKDPAQSEVGRELASVLLEAGADPGLLGKRIKKTPELKALLAQHGNKAGSKKAVAKKAGAKKAGATKKPAPKKGARR